MLESITGEKTLVPKLENSLRDLSTGSKIDFSSNRISTTVFIGPRCPWGPIYGSACPSVRPRPCVDLTDVTLADEDTNSILTDNANRAI